MYEYGSELFFERILVKKNMITQTSPIIHVLLADDHAIVRAGVRKFLEHSPDIKVIAEASNGQEAYKFLEHTKTDVAVLDIHMPISSGIDVLRQIRVHRWPIGVLILTSYDDDPYISAVLRAGADGYVLKTASPDEIVNAVRDVYKGKSVLDASILPKVFAEFDLLTEREIEILALVAKGLTNKEVGKNLTISDRTVQGHIACIFEKLQAKNRTEAVMRGLSCGLIHIPDGMKGNPINFYI